MIKYFVAMTITILIMAAPAQSAILFYDDAEDTYSESDWYWPPHFQTYGRTITASSEQKRAGSKSYKFVLPYPYISSINNSHVELLLNATKSPTYIQNFPYNKEFWVGYSIYIPSDFVVQYNPNHYGLTMQFHNSPDAPDCDNIYTTGMVAACQYQPTLGVWRWLSGGDTARCSTGFVIAHARTATYTPGTWHDIVLNFKFDYRTANNPFFRVWVNGTQVMNYSGVNCYNDARGPRFHIGIYAQPLIKDFIVYYDEIKIGDANSSYAEVAPAGGPVYPDPVEITTSSLGNFVEDETTTGTLAATGGTSPYTWSSADKPAWFSLNTSGAWSAAPTASGAYSFTVIATDSEGATDSQTFSGTISAAAIVLPKVTAFSMPYRNTSRTVPITTFTGDATSVAYITVTDSDTPPASGAAGWAGSAPTQIVFDSDGEHEVRAYVKNANGDVSPPAFAAVMIDPNYVEPEHPVTNTGPKTLRIR